MDTQQGAYKHALKNPTGLRKLTPPMLGTLKAAERFGGIDEITPGQVLAAFKAAAPHLGYRPGVVHAVDWLFRFTQATDWQAGTRPVVWPSAAMQQAELSLGESQVKKLNRQLIELGLVAMKDSPNGKRYGRRGPKGRIIEAYGFDLSPLADRLAEFQAVAEEAREIRNRTQALRRRTTIARNGMRQIFETAAEEGLVGVDWKHWQEEASKLGRGIAGVSDVNEMEWAVVRLERFQADARQALDAALEERREALMNSVNISPTGLLKEPHITSTNQLLNPKDTVIAPGKSSFEHSRRQTGRVGAASSSKEGVGRSDDKIKQAAPRDRSERTDNGGVMKMTPDELVRLAPRLRPYLANPAPNWPEIVEAADWLRHDLGVSKPLWGEACLTMGREQAAIALAIVSTKPPEHFLSSPGGYFRGMVVKAKAGELHLSRTLWGIRERGGAPTARNKGVLPH
jgi:replication initiation protein RepC